MVQAWKRVRTGALGGVRRGSLKEMRFTQTLKELTLVWKRKTFQAEENQEQRSHNIMGYMMQNVRSVQVWHPGTNRMGFHGHKENNIYDLLRFILQEEEEQVKILYLQGTFESQFCEFPKDSQIISLLKFLCVEPLFSNSLHGLSSFPFLFPLF